MSRNFHFRAGPSFVIIALAFALHTAGGTLPIPLYTLWGEDFGFGAQTITWVFAVYVLGVLITLLFFGSLSDRIGRRPLIISALALTISATLLFVFSVNIPMLLVGRFLSGMGVGLITSAATAALAEVYAGGRPAVPQVVSTVANMGGLGLGPLFSGIFAEYLPNPAVTVFVVFLGLAVLVTVLFAFVPETHPHPRGDSIDWMPRIGVPRPVVGVFVRSSLAVFPTFTLLGFFSSLTPQFIHGPLGIESLLAAGLAAFVLFEIGVVAQLAARSREPRGNLLVGLPLLGAALGLVLGGFLMENPWLFGCGTVLGGVGAGLTFMGGLSRLAQVLPHESHAQGVAAYFVVAQVGLAVPVLLIGFLSKSLGLAQATFVIVGFMLALVLVAFLANLRKTADHEKRRPSTIVGSTRLTDSEK